MSTNLYSNETPIKGSLEINQRVREREQEFLLNSKGLSPKKANNLLNGANIIPFLFASFFVK